MTPTAATTKLVRRCGRAARVPLLGRDRYSDARDFKTGERVRINTVTAEIEATVGGYIKKDEREEMIFKANTDVADIIGLTERAGIMRNIEIQRVLE